MPPYGWVGIDATLGIRCTGRHVKVGVGRDYADVAVLRGTYHGGGDAALEVSVSSESLDGVAHVGLGGDGDAGRAARGDPEPRRPAAVPARIVPLRPALAVLPPRAGLDDLPPPRAQRGRRRGRSHAAAAPAAAGGSMQLRVGCRFDYETTARRRP